MTMAAVLALAAAASGFVDVPGGRLAYEVAGQGETVVLVHDGLLPSATWDLQFTSWARRFRVVRYDRRGYGASTTDTADYSHLDDLRAVLDHVGASRASLVGCSSGSALALDFAIAYPDRVSSLVLVGPVLSGFGYSEHFVGRALGNSEPLFMSDDEAGTVERWASDPWLIDPRNGEARRRLRELVTRYPQGAARKILESTRPEPGSRTRLGEVRVPVLLVAGDGDIPDVHAHAGAIAAGIRHAERMVMPEAGHLLHLERPAAFEARAYEFLDPKGTAAALLAAGLRTPATAEARGAFDYDRSAPLALEEKAVEERPAARVRDVTYASPGGRVPAYVVEPKTPGPHAGLVFLHHGQGNRTTFLEEAVGWAGRGVVSVLIDAPDRRESARTAPPPPPYDPAAERGEIVQTVVDLRRAFDLLASRPDVDAKRLAYVGYSLGATMGARLAGLEERARGHVLVAGFAALSYDMDSGHHPAAAAFRALVDETARNAYRAAVEPLDGTHFLGDTAPLFLQFARADEYISRVDAELFMAAAAPGRAEARWYDGGHFDLSGGPARAEREAWLARLLEVTP